MSRREEIAQQIANELPAEVYFKNLLEFVQEHEITAEFVKNYYHAWLVKKLEQNMPDLH